MCCRITLPSAHTGSDTEPFQNLLQRLLSPLVTASNSQFLFPILKLFIFIFCIRTSIKVSCFPVSLFYGCSIHLPKYYIVFLSFPSNLFFLKRIFLSTILDFIILVSFVIKGSILLRFLSLPPYFPDSFLLPEALKHIDLMTKSC